MQYTFIFEILLRGFALGAAVMAGCLALALVAAYVYDGICSHKEKKPPKGQ